MLISSDFYLRDNGKPNKTFWSITQTSCLICYTVMVQDDSNEEKKKASNPKMVFLGKKASIASGCVVRQQQPIKKNI